jgi:hypothetical protein
MALTPFQRRICRLLADHRIASGESYVAGGVALNELIGAPRRSNDIDLFHDADEALETSWEADRELLLAEKFEVETLRERPFLVEARVRYGGESTLMQWARDSAYRFFPLVEHPDLGLVLHPFDLATNKALALVGRLEVRDWVDVIECDARIQSLGYLAWAACGKDPGFSPAAILEHAARSARYTGEEVSSLAFEGEAPDPGELSRRWHRLLDDAHRIVSTLPAQEVGKCVLEVDGGLCRSTVDELPAALARGEVRFHPGSLRGALATPVA